MFTQFKLMQLEVFTIVDSPNHDFHLLLSSEISFMMIVSLEPTEMIWNHLSYHMTSY